MILSTERSLAIVAVAPFAGEASEACGGLLVHPPIAGWNVARILYVTTKFEAGRGVLVRNLAVANDDLLVLRNVALAGGGDASGPGAVGRSAYFRAGFTAIALRDEVQARRASHVLVTAPCHDIPDGAFLDRLAAADEIAWIGRDEVAGASLFMPLEPFERRGATARAAAGAYLSGAAWSLGSVEFPTVVATAAYAISNGLDSAAPL